MVSLLIGTQYTQTHFHRDQFPQWLNLVPQSITNLANNLSSSWCRQISPHLPRFLRRLNTRSVIVDIPLLHLCYHPAITGTNRLHHLSTIAMIVPQIDIVCDDVTSPEPFQLPSYTPKFVAFSPSSFKNEYFESFIKWSVVEVDILCTVNTFLQTENNRTGTKLLVRMVMMLMLLVTEGFVIRLAISEIPWVNCSYLQSYVLKPVISYLLFTGIVIW